MQGTFQKSVQQGKINKNKKSKETKDNISVKKVKWCAWDCLVVALKTLYPGKPLSPRQTEVVGHLVIPVNYFFFFFLEISYYFHAPFTRENRSTKRSSKPVYSYRSIEW